MFLFDNHKISKLDETLQWFITETGKSMSSLHLEMKEFKDEMKEFKDEMTVWREKADKQLEESRIAREEDKKKWDEQNKKWEEQKIRQEKEQREWNKKWGEIANKFGTFTEDIVIPNMETIAMQYFGMDINNCEFKAERVKRNNIITKKQKEFDYIVAVENKIILNETKSTPRKNYVDDFINFIRSDEFKNYFPEYKDYILIPIFATFYVPEDIVKYLTKNRVFVMGMKNDTMDLINFDDIK